MKLHDLRPAEGAKKNRKRVGRGIAAGQGKTAGRGTKGQNARAGGGVRPYFEGGQLPIVRRLPHKRGFKNPFKVYYVAVNIERLNDFEENAVITPEILVEAGVVRSPKSAIVVLGDGELTKALVVKAHRFSVSAREKITGAGGTVEELALSVRN
jgi:large subunit ribosomal protein L15